MKATQRRILLILASALAVSCSGYSKKSFAEFAENLALRDDLTAAQEAVVWTLSATGQVTSYWIKNDVTGVLITAWRDDLVIPLNDALWRLENDSSKNGLGDDADHNDIVFRDLLHDVERRIPLEPASESPDAGLEDAGPPGGSCEPTLRQGRVFPLISVGNYLFLKYSEDEVTCDGEVRLSHEKYVAVDLRNFELAEVLTDAEKEALSDHPDVKALRSEGDPELVGSVPRYNPAFVLSMVHVFEIINTAVDEDGLTHSFVHSLAISDTQVPERLKNVFLPPELVQAFGMSIPDETLGGFWAVGGDPDALLAQFAVFSGRAALNELPENK